MLPLPHIKLWSLQSFLGFHTNDILIEFWNVFTMRWKRLSDWWWRYCRSVQARLLLAWEEVHVHVVLIYWQVGTLICYSPGCSSACCGWSPSALPGPACISPSLSGACHPLKVKTISFLFLPSLCPLTFHNMLNAGHLVVDVPLSFLHQKSLQP